jgi:hypothetical protein
MFNDSVTVSAVEVPAELVAVAVYVPETTGRENGSLSVSNEIGF